MFFGNGLFPVPDDMEYMDYVEMCIAQGVCPDCGGELIWMGEEGVFYCPECDMTW